MRLKQGLYWFLSVLLTFVFFACAEGQSSNSNDPPKDPPGDDVPGDDEPGDDDPAVKDAEYWARAAIAGSVDKLEAFVTISQTTGFPVKCKNGKYLFLHWYDQGQWSVAGDFNNWSPQAMTKSGTDLWHAEISVSAPQGAGYKFVNNSTQYLADAWSRAYQYDENGEISYVQAPQSVHLERYHQFAGQGLKPRMLSVYVPAGSGPWPVLYAHDGQNLYSPQAMNGGWKLREAMQQIGGEFLIVGIDNTEDRMQEYTHVDDKIDGTIFVAKGRAYADFVEKDLRPFIEKQYKTKPVRGLMGSSLGGLISLYIAHLYPESYVLSASLSGTLAWGRFGLGNTTMQTLYTQAGKRAFVVYADSGGGPGSGCSTGPQDALVDEDDRDNYCSTKSFVEALHGIGYEYEVDLYHWHEQDAPHNEQAWAARVNKPLSIFKALGEK